MALSKQKKNEIVDQYKNWLSQSQAVILVEYTGTTVKDLDKIRAKMREVWWRISRCQEHPGDPGS